jgi:hypothetical protein
MKKSHLKPEMTYTTSTSVSAITTTTTTSTSSSDNVIIKTKIANTTEGLSPSCFNYLSNRVLPASKDVSNNHCPKELTFV